MDLPLKREKLGCVEVGDGGVVLQLDNVQFIGIIVYIYDSKKRYKPSCILHKMSVLAKVCLGYL